jgi:hypothetical protein
LIGCRGLGVVSNHHQYHNADVPTIDILILKGIVIQKLELKRGIHKTEPKDVVADIIVVSDSVHLCCERLWKLDLWV